MLTKRAAQKSASCATMRRVLLKSAAVLLLPVVTLNLSHACVNAPRQILRKHLDVPAGTEINLKVLDLLSITVPGGAANWRVDAIPGEDLSLLRQLTPEQMESALKSERFRTSHVSLAGTSPSDYLRQLHFGAIAAGSGDLVLLDASDPPVRHRFHVEVSARERPPAARSEKSSAATPGTVHRVDADAVTKEISLALNDVLEVTLPGAIDDDFAVTTGTTGLAFKEKRPLGGGRITFVFESKSRTPGLLTIRSPGKQDGLYGIRIAYPMAAQVAC